MKISVLDEHSESIFSFEMEDDDTVADIKALVEVNTLVSISNQTLLYMGRTLADTETLRSMGMQNDDLIYMRRQQQQQQQQAQQRQQQQQRAQSNAASGSGLQQNLSEMNSEQLLQYFRSNPQFMQQIQTSNPHLYRDILQGNTAMLMRALAPMIERQRAQAREQSLHMRLNNNPYDVDAQRELEEMIRQKNVEENYFNAMEHSPESFASVIMLYIDCKVNGTPLKAFIDSGAQMSIMSRECAERCNLLRLMDPRFQGMALGVGSAKIAGRIHLTSMQVGGTHFPITITVLEQKGMEFLLGLDMLKRHQCKIDLESNVLRIGPEEAPFLQEKDLKEILKKEKEEPSSPLSPKFAAPRNESSSASVSSSSPSSSSSSSSSSTTTLATERTQQPKTNELPASVTEENIKVLVDMGFPRQQVIEALIAAHGNPNVAASFLF